MWFRVGLVFAALLGATPALSQGSWEDRRVERLATPEFEKFENERAYRDYVRDVERMRRQIREDGYTSLPPAIVVAQAEVDPLECNPLLAECSPLEDDEGGTILVTGARAPSSPSNSAVAVTSITNNQTANVDEGDIVKRIGDYLLVLQDGRVFAINFRTMQMTDRVDAFRRDERGRPIGADWYDEMLIEGDHILITAYSYDDDASEISVFRLDQSTGRIERRGVFLMSSEDYYDIDNYATRVVGDRLVIYTPYEPEDLVNRRNRPVVRRWSPADEYDDREKGGDPILSATDIYRPVFGVFEPMVHTISVCDLGELDGDSLDCQTTGFIAGSEAEMFVSPQNIFLFASAGSWQDRNGYRICQAARAGWQVPTGGAPGAVFRLPLGRDEPDLLAVRGLVIDQFAMDQFGSRFRIVTYSRQFTCTENARYGYGYEDGERRFELVDSSVGAFIDSYRPARDRDFTALPDPGEGAVENRFIGDWLLLGSRSRWGRPPDDDEAASQGFVQAIPLLSPTTPQRVALGHEVTRIEALGRDAVITGYADRSGLNISLLDLAETARVADSLRLDRRFESENRSHAFNAIIYEGGDGLMGLPTVKQEEDSGRRWWRSENSDISFLRFGADGTLSDIGAVRPAEGSEEARDGYSCEVSCIDWYGNARPIFIERGVYALMGTELVEGRALSDRVETLRRVDLTAPFER